MRDNDDNNGIIDTIDKVIGLYEENKDMLEGALPSGNSVKIDDKSPLREAIVTDSEVTVVMEVKGEGFENIRVDDTDDGIIVGLNGKTVKAEVPSDVDIDQAEASLNNGVLEVQIPREGGGE